MRYFPLIILILFASMVNATEPASEVDVQPVDEEGIPWFEGDKKHPNLKSGELGVLPEGAEQEHRTWNRAMPFLAQKVIDLGFDLPNPYGFGGVYADIRQEIVLSELEVGINGGEKQPVDFIDFGKSTAENRAAQLKLDTWVFPFLNVYGVIGRFDGKAEIPLAIPGDEILKLVLPAIGALCDRPPGFPGRPDLCDQLLTGTALPKYNGSNIGIGFTLAMGWRNYFIAIPATYVKTDINIIETNINTWQIAPRIGFTIDLDGPGMLALYTGGSWMDVDLEISGKVVLSGPGEPTEDNTFIIDYTLHERNKDPWNMLVGVNWDINANWALQAEFGFAGSRDHFISSLVYRW